MINLNKKTKCLGFNIKTWAGGLLIPAFFLVVVACQHDKVIYTPEGYDITSPQKISLGSKLDEISGICWVNDSTMIANDDERGRIYAIDIRDKKNYNYRSIKFGPKDDYEDIIKVEDTIFVLLSTGSIMKVTGYRSEDSIQASIIATVPGKGNEFESMYYDPEAHSIILVCKECHKEKDQVRTAYRYDINEQRLIDTAYYSISIKDIRKVMDDGRAEFKPSAAAIHPIQQKLYLVSSVGKVLVVTDKMGNVEQAIPISPIMFPQPEGITFAPNGDMYISNEKATEERATLLKFVFKSKK